jgi:putative ABC transport system permease protein
MKTAWRQFTHSILPCGIPFSWRQLSIERLRLAAAVAGIAFASVMMLMQLGFHDALYRSATLFHSQLDGDLVIISTEYESLISTRAFTQRRLYQALQLAEVESFAPVLFGSAPWKNPETGKTRMIFVIGVDPGRATFLAPDIQAAMETLKTRDAVLFDAESRDEFGPVSKLFGNGGEVRSELANQRVRVSGIYHMGAGFAADGVVLTSDFTFLKALGDRAVGMIDMGILKLKPGANAIAARDQLQHALPADVRVLTRDQLIQAEIDYWARRTPIGFVISAGMLIGFIVGGVIVYQILYTDVTDHLAEYATLKALGYSDQSLFGVVLQQAVILSALGFIPATALASLIFLATRKFAMLPAWLTWDRTALVFLLTLTMCAAAGAFATKKLRSADPAEVF